MSSSAAAAAASEQAAVEQAFIINAVLLVLAAFGAIQLGCFAYGLVSFVYRTYIRKPYVLSSLYGAGGWACITGATDGVGKALAFEFAQRGLNVLLISRTESKLQQTQAEILAKYPKVKVDYVAVDYSTVTADEYAALQQRLLSLDGVGLTVLVNNVGVSYDFPNYFEDLSEDRVRDLVRLNVDSTTQMTKLGLHVLKHKSAQQQRRRGAIINLASAAGLTSNPLLTQYSAAKAYVQRFSEGLAIEVRAQGVDVQCHVPFFIVSKMSKFRSASALVPSAEAYAKLVVRAVGQHEVVINPFPPHALLGFLVKNVFPNALRERFTRNHHQAIRAKALKRAAANKKE